MFDVYKKKPRKKMTAIRRKRQRFQQRTNKQTNKQAKKKGVVKIN
jgi:hypothetical protein